MSSLETAAALLRGIHVAALVSLSGTLAFLVLVAPSSLAQAVGEAPLLRRRLLLLAAVSTACALLSGVAWLTTETAVIAGADGVAMTWRALPTVAFQTQFGHWLVARGVLLLVISPLLRQSWVSIAIATLMAAIALALQPMLGHAGATGGNLGNTLITSEVMHLLAAGTWLGGLLPLFITIGTLPYRAAATACFSFTPIGLSAVLILGGTATLQVVEFMGGLAGLFGTGYGHVALVKLGLFLVLLTLAAINRLVLTERLLGKTQDAGRRHIRMSIATEAVLGALVIMTAAFLASHTPGTHEQPVWPFAWRPSIVVLSEPDFRVEVVGALVAVGVALTLAILGSVWWRIRWPAFGASVIIVTLSLPHLNLLLVQAYPTSFFISPTEFAATAIVHGAKLFATNCTACHGTDGRGDGPVAKSLPVPPADLTAEHFWAHSDGELFWYISHGFETPDGRVSMPGFGGVLSSEARWDLIDFLRAHNAGVSMRTTGHWRHSLPIPQFDVECADGSAIDLDDLRGKILHVVAELGEEAPASAAPTAIPVTTIVLSQRRMSPMTPACRASEPETWSAFSILTGVPSRELAGEQVLVDQNTWLRAAWRPGSPGNWADSREFTAMVANIAAHPVPVDAAGGHVHHH
jgi:putative copper export protein/mono/diheme cytochrome c family protein